MTGRDGSPPQPGDGHPASRERASELHVELARRIVEYLRRRVLDTGSHLTEKELAEEFGVSRSPIRSALAYLAEKEILERKPNRGFFVAADRARLDPDRLGLPPTVEEERVLSISRDWVEGRVPSSFSEAMFRRCYRLGRLAASRVLLRLSEDGIISRRRGLGWQFESSPDTRAANNESWFFRITVEPAAIRSPRFELDRVLAEASRRNHEVVLNGEGVEPPVRVLGDINTEFHRLIGVSSRNRFLLAAIEQQSALRRILAQAFGDREHLIGSCAEHLEILSALEQDDREEAAARMERHLAGAHDASSWRYTGT